MMKDIYYEAQAASAHSGWIPQAQSETEEHVISVAKSAMASQSRLRWRVVRVEKNEIWQSHPDNAAA